jgi:hypothetical protein
MAEPWPADKVERWPVAKLVPNARNARTHSDEQVTQLAASIEEWVWTIPVLVDEAGGIIAGHGRVMAAHRLGIEDVPVMVAAGWTEAKKRAYMLADNKLTLNGEWDLERLAIESAELRASDFDVSLIGFSESEIDDLLKADGGGLTDPDEAPEPSAEPVSKVGDVWPDVAGHRGFRINALVSLLPNASWGQLAKEYLEAKRGGPLDFGERPAEHGLGVKPQNGLPAQG